VFVDILIRIVERILYNTPVKPALDPEKMQSFYKVLYDLPGYRQYVVERETRLVHALASEKDSEARSQMRGQRVENSLLFAKAQRAAEKAQKDKNS
jgi:hypothetical protein